jgi:hypothetical protein
MSFLTQGTKEKSYKFSSEALDQLRTAQNDQIGKIFTTYKKTPIAFKINETFQEYVRQLAPSSTREERFKAKVRPIKYSKIPDKLNQIEKRKSRLLKSQHGSKNGESSVGSDSEKSTQFKFGSGLKLNYMNSYRGSSVTDSLALRGTKSPRRENVALSLNQPLQSSIEVVTKSAEGSKKMDKKYAQFLNARNHISRNHSPTSGPVEAKTQGNPVSLSQSYGQFKHSVR